MSDKEPSPREYILDLAFRAFEAQAVYTAATLGLADHLEKGAMHVDQLATTVNCDSSSLRRLLRALASIEIFEETKPGFFGMTEKSRLLAGTHPASVRDSVLVAGGPLFNLPCSKMAACVRSGVPAFEEIHGKGFFEYLAHDQEAGRLFHSGMASHSGAENAMLVDAYDFSQFHRIADLGGGQGGLMTAILRACPQLHGVLFDRSPVAELPGWLAEAGVADRCEIVAGDFFTHVPNECDAYILKRVIHDWDDESAVKILRNCGNAVSPGGKVLIVDMVIPEGNDPHPGKWADLVMMVLLQGRERTEQEFRDPYYGNRRVSG